MRHPDADMPERPVGVPDAVWSAVESVRSMPRVTGMRYRELPVPSTLADYGIGVEMECVADDDSRSFGDAHMASGWIMLLYVERERETGTPIGVASPTRSCRCRPTRTMASPRACTGTGCARSWMTPP